MARDSPRIRVVLAEDHTLMRQMTRSLLEGSGMEVVAEAADGAEAVTVCTRMRPDVVLMDIAMPGVNGVEATRQIKERCPSTAVLVLTAYDDDQYVTALVQAGAAGYLLKTIQPQELVDATRSVFNGESVLHPKIARKVLQKLCGQPQSQGGPPLDPLSERELLVLRLAARGLSNKEIGNELALSERTVQTHLSHIFAKAGVASRTEAAIAGLRRGWLRLEDLGVE